MADDKRPLITVDTCVRLVDGGIIGEKIELIKGRLVFGDFELAFSPAQRAAAAELGIELPENHRLRVARTAAHAVLASRSAVRVEMAIEHLFRA